MTEERYFEDLDVDGGKYRNKSDMGCGDVDWINRDLEKE